MDDSFRPVTLSPRTHCSLCGHRKAKRWGEGRTTLTKFCANESCQLFGVPMLMSVKTIVTIDRLGRPHVRHKEVAIRRRATFALPTGVMEGGSG